MTSIKLNISSTLMLFVLLLIVSPTILRSQMGAHGFLGFEEFSDSITITTCDQEATGELEIPAFINGKPVTSIGVAAFRECGNLTQIIIPPSVSFIGARAFLDCWSLTSIAIPEGVTAIGDETFMFCSSLAQITIPETVVSIGERAFRSCSSLTGVTIPEGVPGIWERTFTNCTSLTSLVLPQSLLAIGDRAFRNCTSLTSLTIPASVTSIDYAAFTNCTGLISVTLSDNITWLGETAFYGCSSLTSITIPRGLTSIEWSTFYGCSSLTSITIPAEIQFIGDLAFAACSSLTRAIFLGDAPNLFPNSFADAASGFTTYHFDDSSGFTTPTWVGYPATNIGSYSPVKPWLLENNFAHDTDPVNDANGDGVSLLMAYALNLDPNTSLAGDLPRAGLLGGALQLPFHGAAEGIVYTPETSVNLVEWTTNGIVLTEPDANGVATASVPFDDRSRFLRLRVQLQE